MWYRKDSQGYLDNPPIYSLIKIEVISYPKMKIISGPAAAITAVC